MPSTIISQSIPQKWQQKTSTKGMRNEYTISLRYIGVWFDMRHNVKVMLEMLYRYVYYYTHLIDITKLHDINSIKTLSISSNAHSVRMQY